MASMTTQDLHARADHSAAQGDFESALRYSAEALRLVPLDHRARLKVALCLAAYGRTEPALDALAITAETLSRRGYHLAAIGACRDALGLGAAAPAVRAALEGIHARIGGRDGRGRGRVPPPTVPADVSEDDPATLIAVRDPAGLIEAASALAVRDPDGQAPSAPPGAHVPLFSDLSRDAFLSLVGRIGYLKLPAGQAVVREGDQGSSLFIVVQGEVRVTREVQGATQVVATLGPGSIFGELALIRAKPRGATVTTSQPAELFEIAREAVEQVAAAHPAITEDLVQFARRRLVTNLFATSKIFRPFDEAQRAEILREFESRAVSGGTRLIEEGHEPAGLYVVLEGEVEVSKRDTNGEQVVLAYLREGEVFGEIGLVEKRLTVASVSASERSVLLYLDRARFEAFAARHPKILEYLATLSGARLTETEQAMAADGLEIDAADLVIG